MWNPIHRTRDWNWRVCSNPAKPAGWRLRARVWPTNSHRVRFLDGSRTELTHICSPNPDPLLTLLDLLASNWVAPCFKINEGPNIPSWTASTHLKWYHGISHRSWFTPSSGSGILHMAGSVSASDWQTWNSTHLWPVKFAAPQTSSSAAGFIWASFLAEVLLELIALVSTSCNGWLYIMLEYFVEMVAFDRCHFMDFGFLIAW